ncbi:MAG: hypothetical protein A2W90_12150 [Bacteroidetes bacterium GWF2_42_66]|nr:MAG: hypothetical protein A2W92_23275 [Bacteroidetes bacterium GWA2_42_15]OFX99942.1 MAG: hypothetical protein A2W89_17135 [Bacteroidetes bacterium GWE2_42_39]OFY40127.1 MAG: hypothetical protein A2W90_12150 [Bacteroidetes bacterium GWF2_42_66]HBL73951.1 gluconolaconase [Prolixibacteraceae bacterium]HCR89239.1 gluconolaconase [Prolixibacteraceae bacterium]
MEQHEKKIENSQFEVFADCPCTVAEGPLWHEGQQTLYWVDVTLGIVYLKRYNASVNDYKYFDLKLGKIGGMVFLNNNYLLLFAAQGKVWKWSPELNSELYAELPEAIPSRFNDVIVDPEGRVFCGVAPVEKGGSGSLWRMGKDKSFVCLEPHTAGMPNGMGFSPDLHYFYFTITDERIIYRYQYDRSTGDLSEKEAFIRVPDNEGLPDGMTVDTDGCIWSAQWNGHRLVRYSPSSEKLEEFLFPIAKVSSAVFGGKNYSELFVTTANYPWNEDDYKRLEAGMVFKLQKNYAGLPENIRYE